MISHSIVYVATDVSDTPYYYFDVVPTDDNVCQSLLDYDMNRLIFLLLPSISVPLLPSISFPSAAAGSQVILV